MSIPVHIPVIKNVKAIRLMPLRILKNSKVFDLKIKCSITVLLQQLYWFLMKSNDVVCLLLSVQSEKLYHFMPIISLYGIYLVI